MATTATVEIEQTYRVGSSVRVATGVRGYAGRVGTVREYAYDEIGVRFNSASSNSNAVWFRPAELAAV